MRALRWVLLGLVLLLGWLQYRLWFGSGSAGEVAALATQVEHQRRENGGLEERNAALGAEVRDLKEGVAAVEERARSELGMVKPGEVFYRVVEDPSQRPATPAGSAQDDSDAADPAGPSDETVDDAPEPIPEPR
jgi:cell division protein FtsB